MSDREMIEYLAKKCGLKVQWQDEKCVEIDNSYGGEDIVFDFDINGNITDIGC